ncbi:hypothetical protein BGLA2_380021 [Burkholderia gladioli]|nr:hypothetical protein BGLA2_380021 [Burkholderia gladioli]
MPNGTRFVLRHAGHYTHRFASTPPVAFSRGCASDTIL